MFLLGGRMMDVLGTRLGMALVGGVLVGGERRHAVVQNAFHLGAAGFFSAWAKAAVFPARPRAWRSGSPSAAGDGDGDRHRRIGPGRRAPPLTVWLAAARGLARRVRCDRIDRRGMGRLLVRLLSSQAETLDSESQPAAVGETETGHVPLSDLLGRVETWGWP